MSGAAEKDFDLGLRVNLDGTRPTRFFSLRCGVSGLGFRVCGIVSILCIHAHQDGKNQEQHYKTTSAQVARAGYDHATSREEHTEVHPVSTSTPCAREEQVLGRALQTADQETANKNQLQQGQSKSLLGFRA